MGGKIEIKTSIKLGLTDVIENYNADFIDIKHYLVTDISD
jgi:hypothetical protein